MRELAAGSPMTLRDIWDTVLIRYDPAVAAALPWDSVRTPLHRRRMAEVPSGNITVEELIANLERGDVYKPHIQKFYRGHVLYKKQGTYV